MIQIEVDISASCYYISNANNVFIGNACAGAWSGFHFPMLPEPIDTDIRDSYAAEGTMFTPNRRPMGTFVGNSAHSVSWWTKQPGAVYIGKTTFLD